MNAPHKEFDPDYLIKNVKLLEECMRMNGVNLQDSLNAMLTSVINLLIHFGLSREEIDKFMLAFDNALDSIGARARIKDFKP